MTNKNKLMSILADPILWIQAFVTIQDKNQKMVKFILNDQQRYLLQNMERCTIVDKSRQIGISSVALAYSLYISHVQPGAKCMLIADCDNNSQYIWLKLKALYNALPDIVRVPCEANNRKELLLKNGSRITVNSCTRAEKRGESVSFVHMSEFAFFSTPESQLAAILSSLLPTGKLLIESTPNGTNYFCKLFNKAVRKENAFKPIFFSWIDVEMYKEEQRLFKTQYIKTHKGIPLKDENLDEDEIKLREMGATLTQLMWRRIKIGELGGVDFFKREFPATATESFIANSGNAVFSPEKISERLEEIRTIEEKLMPNDAPDIIKKWKRNIKIWRLPDNGKRSTARYFIGCDPAAGTGNDDSAIVVLDEQGRECLEFTSDTIKSFDLADLVEEIGNWYNFGQIICENASVGLYVLPKLQEKNYHNLYRQRRFAKGGRGSYGFNTSAGSKEIIVNQLQEHFETDQIEIFSEKSLHEMRAFQITDSGKYQGIGDHDDLVMALALALESKVCGRYF